MNSVVLYCVFAVVFALGGIGQATVGHEFLATVYQIIAFGCLAIAARDIRRPL